jgi:hypothetical protein
MAANEFQLLCELLTSVGSGSSSCAALQRRTALESPQGYQTIREIGNIDSHHFERDLHRWASKQEWRHLLPDIYSFPLQVHTPAGPAEKTHGALLPHEVFHHVHQHPALFERLFTGGQQSLEAWWRGEEQADSCWYRDHPVIARVPDSSKRVPVGMHGDDAGVYGEQQVLCLTWGSVVSQLPTLDNRILFSMIRVSDILQDVQDTTRRTLFQVMQWSFAAASAGVFPYCDHAGRPFGVDYHPRRAALAGKRIAGDFVCCWSEMRGDWKFLQQALRLKQYYLTNYTCHLCRAHRRIRRLRATNYRRDAHLRCTRVDCRAFQAEYQADPWPSPLLEIPGFCVWRVFFDILHTLDLGILQVTLPSVMWELTEGNAGVWPGAARNDRFRAAFLEYRDWCARNRVSTRVKKAFDRKQWRKPGRYPKITQKVAKGAATRTLLYWFAEVSARVADQHGAHGRMRAAMLAEFVRADEVYRRSGRHLTNAEWAAAAEAVEAGLCLNNALAVEAKTAGQRLYKLLPKHHAMTHIAYDCKVNPRRASCYQDEDMVGRCKRIYNKCHANSAPVNGLRRYVILVGVRWWAELRNSVLPPGPR